MNSCGISKQIAKHCDEPAESFCDECDSVMTLEYDFKLGEYLECENGHRIYLGEDE